MLELIRIRRLSQVMRIYDFGAFVVAISAPQNRQNLPAAPASFRQFVLAVDQRGDESNEA